MFYTLNIYSECSQTKARYQRGVPPKTTSAQLLLAQVCENRM